MEYIELSIVVPVYNVEKYLDECLENIYKIMSIKKEVILVNDGSTDSSLEILKKYKEKFPEITRIINKKNAGLSDTRNVGMEESKGEYIYFIDSDDFIDSKKFESIFQAGRIERADIIKASGYSFKETRIEKLDNQIIESRVYKGTDLIKLLHKDKIIRVEVCLSIYKLEFLKKTKITFEKGLIFEDTIFSYQCWLADSKIFYSNEKFYYYRVREGSIMTTGIDREKFKHKLRNCKLLIKEQEKRKKKFDEIYSLILNITLVGVIRFKYYDESILKKLFEENLRVKLRLKLIVLKIYIKIFKCKKIEV